MTSHWLHYTAAIICGPDTPTAEDLRVVEEFVAFLATKPHPNTSTPVSAEPVGCCAEEECPAPGIQVLLTDQGPHPCPDCGTLLSSTPPAEPAPMGARCPATRLPSALTEPPSAARGQAAAPLDVPCNSTAPAEGRKCHA